jgi:anti-sigma regulatory factor (Ser/Thr protein kinase)
MATELPSTELLDHLLDELHGFVGKGWDQEDDITLVALQRTGGGATALGAETEAEAASDRVLLRDSLPGEPGNERVAMDRVAEAVAGIAIEPARLERLRTAVSEAAMNAIEYGSQNDPAIPIEIEVVVTGDDLIVRITDRGLGGPLGDAEEPDIEKKLAGDQKPRGWGLFLIKHMVDAMEVTPHGTGQTVTLTLHLEGANNAGHPVHG